MIAYIRGHHSCPVQVNRRRRRRRTSLSNFGLSPREPPARLSAASAIERDRRRLMKSKDIFRFINYNCDFIIQPLLILLLLRSARPSESDEIISEPLFRYQLDSEGERKSGSCFFHHHHHHPDNKMIHLIATDGKQQRVYHQCLLTLSSWLAFGR